MVVKSKSSLGTHDPICPRVALLHQENRVFFFLNEFCPQHKEINNSHFTVQPSVVELINTCREQFSFIEYLV